MHAGACCTLGYVTARPARPAATCHAPRVPRQGPSSAGPHRAGGSAAPRDRAGGRRGGRPAAGRRRGGRGRANCAGLARGGSADWGNRDDDPQRAGATPHHRKPQPLPIICRSTHGRARRSADRRTWPCGTGCAGRRTPRGRLSGTMIVFAARRRISRDRRAQVKKFAVLETTLRHHGRCRRPTAAPSGRVPSARSTAPPFPHTCGRLAGSAMAGRGSEHGSGGGAEDAGAPVAVGAGRARRGDAGRVATVQDAYERAMDGSGCRDAVERLNECHAEVRAVAGRGGRPRRRKPDAAAGRRATGAGAAKRSTRCAPVCSGSSGGSSRRRRRPPRAASGDSARRADGGAGTGPRRRALHRLRHPSTEARRVRAHGAPYRPIGAYGSDAAGAITLAAPAASCVVGATARSAAAQAVASGSATMAVGCAGSGAAPRAS